MKTSLRNLVLSTGLAIGFSAIAQPTLTATGINPVIGDNIAEHNANYVSPGSAGAIQTWNLSGIGTGTLSTNTGEAVSSTPYASSYANANVAFSGASGTEYLYFKTSTSALQNWGEAVTSGTTSVQFVYSNPEDFLHFPFAYTNTYTDSWQATFTSGGSPYYRKGNTTVTADGYGTLTTPAGTFSNVMRVHFVQVYTDSTNISGFGPYVINYDNDEYMWWLNNNHYPIATVSSFTSVTSFTTSVSQSATYVGGVVAGIDEQADIITSCNLFPNPAANSININLSLTESQAVELKLFNSLGAQVLSSINKEGMQGENNYKLDISTLPEGIYFVQLHLDGNLTSTKRFIVTK
jgi:hypothetical protein